MKTKKHQWLSLCIMHCALCIVLASCNDWLDVRPDTEEKETDQFASVKGFETALTGCYMSMASRDAYGERLTMTNTESLAQLWAPLSSNVSSTRLQDRELMAHDYKGDNARSAIAAAYRQLFYTIASANLIIKHAGQDPQGETAVIAGEAYAIRAYCQLDILRLFGPVPGKGDRELPYSETTSIDELPAYYNYAAYTQKLQGDIDQAEWLLAADPLTQHTWSELMYGEVASAVGEYNTYRQFRLNIWAVRALNARLQLYLGNTAKAHDLARQIIDAKGADGLPLRPLSGQADLAQGYNGCPNECLFALSKYDVLSYAQQTFGCGSKQYNPVSHLVLTTDMLQKLFAGENTGSHNRYLMLWNQRFPDSYGRMWVGSLKYYYDEKQSNTSLYNQLIPMLRTSELYLIAMETATDLAEANALYSDYMLSHNVATAQPFASLEAMRTWVASEYPRELIAEGQTFFAYKRRAATQWLFRTTPVAEGDYVLPLPETEFNPNTMKK